MFGQYRFEYDFTEPTINGDVVAPPASDVATGLYLPSQMTTGQYLRVIIVYVQFKDDSLDLPAWVNWPLNQEPTTWMGTNVIDSSLTQNSTNNNLTHYYNVMSLNKFKIIGKTYSVITANTRQEYINMSYSRGNINKQVLQSLNGQIDYSFYDNWSKDASYVQSWGQDGYADMIIMVYRNIAKDKTNPNYWLTNLDFAGFTGQATLGGGTTITLDKTIIDPAFGLKGSGLTAACGFNGLAYTRNVIVHEIGHHFFGGWNHVQKGAWGIMAGWGDRSQLVNAYERSRLGWGYCLRYDYNPSTPITLSDYVTTGYYLKIKIPNSNPERFYFLENHQKLSSFDNIDQTAGGHGVYVIYQSGGSGDNTKFYNAQGRYNWAFYDSVQFSGYSGKVPVMLRLKQNNLGQFDSDQIIVNNKNYSSILAYRDTINQTNVRYALFLGDGLDMMKPGYVDVMNPYSNPAVEGVSFQVITQNNQIKIKQFVETGTILNSVPSRPQNLDVSCVNNNAYLTWDASKEPDVIGTPTQRGIYKIYRALAVVPNIPTTYTYVGYVTHPIVVYTDNYYYLTPLSGNHKVFYKVSAVDITGLESTKSEMDSARLNMELQKGNGDVGKLSYQLLNNYPNPFNPSTTITFEIPKDNHVELSIYDILGREVEKLVSEFKQAGRYTVSFNGDNLTSGLYFYKLKAGDYSATKKMMLLK
ncbi:MAG: T9SS type A sorting domain-containing protein [bacterium]